MEVPVTPAPGRGPLKILFVASECGPYARTGGLGDVVSALSKELARLGHEVRVVMPLYRSIDRVRHGVTFQRTSCVHMGYGEEAWVGIHTAVLDGTVPVWFVDYDRFFGRPGIYDEPGAEYGDNAFRFGLLSTAALQASLDAGFVPDVVHVHDWPSALSAYYLKRWGGSPSPFARTASVLTIHNIGYPGLYHASAAGYLKIDPSDWRSDRFEDFGQLNLLKCGLVFADALTTVSPTHARELLTPAGGRGLAPFVSAREADLFGILNGIDEDVWDPALDRYIPAHFDADHMEGKSLSKLMVQRFFGLEQRAEIPLFGIVTRLAHQKGIDLLMQAIPAALDRMAIQFVALGNGDAHAEGFLRWLERAYPGRAGAQIGFSNELSHLLEAGLDFFVMPSLYEPCGLNQMYSMRYGTLPIVRATGGLDDTVQNYDPFTGAGTGFKFWDATAQALYDTLGWANATWWDRPHHIGSLRRHAMAQRFSWRDAALRYQDVYAHALAKRHGSGG
ncbi:MAG: glycogen synthase [Deltaproteobacteria bacterium]|nr:glycogen synthase [Deltaproteobacteria bacterium]